MSHLRAISENPETEPTPEPTGEFFILELVELKVTLNPLKVVVTFKK